MSMPYTVGNSFTVLTEAGETGLVEPWSLDALKRRLVAEFPRPLERRRAVPIETLLERGSPPAPWSSSSSAGGDHTGSGDG